MKAGRFVLRWQSLLCLVCFESRHQQSKDGFSQRRSQTLHAVDGDIPLAAFHASHIGAMQACEVRKLLLGKPTRLPSSAKVARKDEARTGALRGSRHPIMLVAMMTIALQTIGSISMEWVLAYVPGVHQEAREQWIHPPPCSAPSWPALM